MKARPRSVEAKVAEALSEIFAAYHLTPVERIPVLGRTGPDITFNELELAIDVKSRFGVPKSIFFPLEIPFAFDCFCGVRLQSFPTLWQDRPAAPLDFSSKVIGDFWQHMEEWTRTERPSAISMLILHRPELPIGSSVAIIHQKDRRRLINNAERCDEQYLSTLPAE